MNELKKISLKKSLRFGVGLIVVILFSVTLIAASLYQGNKTIQGIEVNLNDENDFSFLQRKDIENLLLKNRNIDLKRISLDGIDLKKMEAIAKTNPWVAKVDIYVDNRQILQVKITQREPVARLFDANGGSYYMDSMLHLMPISGGYAYPAPVFTGVVLLKNDSLNKALKTRIAYLSAIISRDSFWQSQITQIDIQPDQTFVLTPLFGNQRILLGDTANATQKLDNLLAFYKQVSGRIGWDKYETLDLRYKDQVVASPSIGWIPPKVTDTASYEIHTAPTLAAARPEPPKIVPAAVVHKPEVKTGKPTAAVKPVAKPMPVAARKTVKPVAIAKQTVKKEPKPVPKTKAATSKDSKKPSPKYLYTGKKTGNH